MRDSGKSRGKMLALFVLLATLFAAVGTVVATNSGRDFTRCVQSCNATRKVCGDNCQSDCRDLYPSNKPLRDACILACKTICNSESDDCKLVCQSIKNPPTEEMP